MNQISGKIIRVGLRHHDYHYYIHHKGVKQKASRGVAFFSIARVKNGLLWMSFQRIPLRLLHGHIMTMEDYPVIEVSGRFHPWRLWLAKLRNRLNSYEGRSIIPFEFYDQPPLPIFSDICPVEDNNITFQRAISEGLQ